MLYVFDQQKKTLIMVDSWPIEKWCKDAPVLMYPRQALGFNLQDMAAVMERGYIQMEIHPWKNIADDIDG